MSLHLNPNRLQEQQNALLHALMAWPRLPDGEAAHKLPIVQHALAARGLNAYRANAHAGAHSALRGAYPVLAQLLGDESFHMLACDFWHHQPPKRGDWAEWGGELPAFIANQAQLQQEVYLPDVARLEWQLHQLGSAPDVEMDASSLQALLQHEPEQLRVQLASHAPVWRSAYPVVSMVLAHAAPQPDLSEAGHLLREGATQEVLVWRQGFKPCVREALPGEAPFLAALQAGQTLSAALQQSPDLNFELWLGTAVQTRLLVTVIPITPVAPVSDF
jgi:hypothetical protein